MHLDHDSIDEIRIDVARSLSRPSRDALPPDNPVVVSVSNDGQPFSSRRKTFEPSRMRVGGLRER
jgi:hypothetical protein